MKKVYFKKIRCEQLSEWAKPHFFSSGIVEDWKYFDLNLVHMIGYVLSG